MKTLASLSLICFVLAACAPNPDSVETNAKLAEANKKIAALEAQLAKVNAPSVTDQTPQAQNDQSAPSSASPPPEPNPEPVGRQWEYEQTEDPMSGGNRYTASVRSSNTVSFGFPYAGAQHGTLTLRTTQGKGKSVMFYIEKGQILCRSYEGCSAQVRFDDEKPVRFAANGPADHSSDIIFLEDYSRFLAKLKKAKRVRIAVDIYQNGAPAFEFDVNGFDPERYVPKA